MRHCVRCVSCGSHRLRECRGGPRGPALPPRGGAKPRRSQKPLRLALPARDRSRRALLQPDRVGKTLRGGAQGLPAPRHARRARDSGHRHAAARALARLTPGSDWLLPTRCLPSCGESRGLTPVPVSGSLTPSSRYFLWRTTSFAKHRYHSAQARMARIRGIARVRPDNDDFGHVT